MVHKKIVSLIAATVIGSALIAAPALAASRGGGGGGGGRGGGAAFHGGGFGGGGGFSGRVGAGSIGVTPMGGFRTGGFGVSRGPVIVNRGFFPRHRAFVRPFFGLSTYAGYSCWRWVPTAFGLRRVWACDYPYGPYY